VLLFIGGEDKVNVITDDNVFEITSQDIMGKNI
jgi:hypothetical protein